MSPVSKWRVAAVIFFLLHEYGATAAEMPRSASVQTDLSVANTSALPAQGASGVSPRTVSSLRDDLPGPVTDWLQDRGLAFVEAYAMARRAERERLEAAGIGGGASPGKEMRSGTSVE